MRLHHVAGVESDLRSLSAASARVWRCIAGALSLHFLWLPEAGLGWSFAISNVEYSGDVHRLDVGMLWSNSSPDPV